jgi:hypothetical protein
MLPKGERTTSLSVFSLALSHPLTSPCHPQDKIVRSQIYRVSSLRSHTLCSLRWTACTSHRASEAKHSQREIGTKDLPNISQVVYYRASKRDGTCSLWGPVPQPQTQDAKRDCTLLSDGKGFYFNRLALFVFGGYNT